MSVISRKWHRSKCREVSQGLGLRRHSSSVDASESSSCKRRTCGSVATSVWFAELDALSPPCFGSGSLFFSLESARNDSFRSRDATSESSRGEDSVATLQRGRLVCVKSSRRRRETAWQCFRTFQILIQFVTRLLPVSLPGVATPSGPHLCVPQSRCFLLSDFNPLESIHLRSELTWRRDVCDGLRTQQCGEFRFDLQLRPSPSSLLPRAPSVSQLERRDTCTPTIDKREDNSIFSWVQRFCTPSKFSGASASTPVEESAVVHTRVAPTKCSCWHMRRVTSWFLLTCTTEAFWTWALCCASCNVAGPEQLAYIACSSSCIVVWARALDLSSTF